MEKNLDFYYVVWGNKRWKILLISIILLRKVYKKNKIIIICYDQPPNYFLEKKEILKYELIYIANNNLIENKFNNCDERLKNLLRSHKNCLYKAINFFEICSNSGSKAILLDCDVFIISSFKNFDWDKLCIYCHENYVNVGVVGYDTNSSSFDIAKKYFYQNISDMMSDSFDQANYIKKALSPEWLNWRLSSLELRENQILDNMLFIHEEMIFNYIFKYQNKEIFHNIGIENNGMILRPERTDSYEKKEINNFHLMGLHPEQVEQILFSIDYFKEIIKNFLKEEKIKELEPSKEDLKKINSILIEKKLISQ